MLNNKLLLSVVLSVLSLSTMASDYLSVKFTRTGTTSSSITARVLDSNGQAVEGATATIASNIDLKGSAGAINESILCPNANANSNPNIEFTLTLNGVASDFQFNTIGMDIHALNGGNSYQDPADGVTRHWNISASVNSQQFGALSDIDIAAGVGASGAVHKVWDITSGTTFKGSDNPTIKIAVTKGTTNLGCFFGLSEIRLSKSDAVVPEPEPEAPEVNTGGGKIYNLTWQNAGIDYITEDDNNKLYVDRYDTTKRQFWEFIPTENEGCFYIRNTATGRYIGSCNQTASSASKIYTTTKPVEYYVGKSASTTGLNANCVWFSSTDCNNYNKESAEPFALNKDGASSDVITWYAGTSKVGSYWKMAETEDLYEIKVFASSSTIGSIECSYNIQGISGKNVSLTTNGVEMSEPDIFNDNQEWYFVGTNNKSGWQILSCTELTTAIGLKDGKVTASEDTSTKWQVSDSKQQKGYFYFTSGGSTLKIEGDSLFKFNQLRSRLSRDLQIYNNPCGVAKDNYATRITVSGNGAASSILYEAKAKPASWHILYSKSKAIIGTGKELSIEVTLSKSAANDLKAYVYFDWNCDGIFETTEELDIDGSKCSAKTTVPSWAESKKSRMRIRINQSGLDLAEDDVEGFVYDFNMIVNNNATTAIVEAIEEEEGISIEQQGEWITATGCRETASMHLYSTDATLIGRSSTNSIYVGNLNCGIYIVKVQTADSSNSAKFLLKK